MIKFYKLFIKNELDYKLWDLKTVTLNDFSVDVDITDEIWRNFMNYYDNKKRIKKRIARRVPLVSQELFE